MSGLGGTPPRPPGLEPSACAVLLAAKRDGVIRTGGDKAQDVAAVERECRRGTLRPGPDPNSYVLTPAGKAALVRLSAYMHTVDVHVARRRERVILPSVESLVDALVLAAESRGPGAISVDDLHESFGAPLPRIAAATWARSPVQVRGAMEALGWTVEGYTGKAFSLVRVAATPDNGREAADA